MGDESRSFPGFFDDITGVNPVKDKSHFYGKKSYENGFFYCFIDMLQLTKTLQKFYINFIQILHGVVTLRVMKKYKDILRRKKMRKLISVVLAVAFAVVLSGLVYAKSGGTTSCNFLKMGVGARAAAMGEAYTAVGDDADSLHWNPAGISLLEGASLKAMHNQWFEDVKLDYIGYARSLGDKGALGLSAKYLWMGAMEKTTAANPAGTGEDFNAYDAAAAITYANKIGGKLGLGASLKLIRQVIDDEDGNAYAGDIGAIYQATDKMTLGASVNNIGSEMKLVEEGFPLPAEGRVGAAYKAFKNLLLSADVKSDAENVSAHIGSEIKVIEALALRAGFKTDTISDIDTMSGLSAGIGINIANLMLDYAWVPYGDLGDTHRISLGLKFGDEGPARSISRKKLTDKQKVALMRKHYQNAQELYNRSEYRAAIKEWENVLKIEPSHKQSRDVIERVKTKLNKNRYGVSRTRIK